MLHLDPQRLTHITREPADEWESRAELAKRLEMAGEELREMRRQLSGVMRNLAGIVYRCEPQAPWATSFVSKSVEDLTGYRAEELEQKRPWLDLMHPDDVPEVEAKVKAAIAEQRVFTLCYRIRHRSGETRWVSEQGQAVCDGSGDPICLEGIITDVTDQKLLEQSLREAEGRAQSRANLLSAALEATLDCVYSLDRNWRFTYLNQRAKDYFGEEQCLIGEPVSRVFPDGPASVFSEPFVRAMDEGAPCSLEGYVPSKGRWYDLNVTPSEEGLTVFFRDITDRKRALQVEKRQSDKLRATLDNVPQMIWSMRSDTGEQYYSRQWLDFTGMEVEDSKPISRLHLVHPDDREQAQGAWEHSLATGDPYRLEYRLRHRSGEYRWIFSQGNPERDADGRVVAWYGTCIDIHDRVIARLELDASEERFRTIIDSMPQIVWSMAEDGCRPDYYNQRWYEFTGLPAGSLEGVEWDGVFHPEDTERMLEIWRLCRATGEFYESEYRLRHRSGEYRWVVSRGRAERNDAGEILRWYGTCTDIHQRVLDRHAANESEKRVQTMLDSVPHIIWSSGPDGKIDYLSNQWREHFDLEEETLAAARWLEILHPEDRPKVAEVWMHALSTGEPYEMEFRVLDGEGVPHWILARALPELNADGEIVRWYGTCTDIHERVIAQQALDASERLNRGIIEASPDCVSVVDLDGTVRFVNEAATRAYKVKNAAEMVGCRWGRIFPPAVRERAEAAFTRAQAGEIAREILQFEDETVRWWDIVIAPIFDDSGIPGSLVVISRDVTDQKDAEEKAQWAANHDTLTKLPNRFLLQNRLDAAIANAVAADGHFALLLIDIDEFKRVNDTVGHDAGDALLCTFADRLRKAIRKGDTVARLGGDEFSVLLGGVGSEAELNAAVAGVFNALKEPCVHGGRMLDCQASIGASIYPYQGNNRTDLLKNADVALYAAKTSGRGMLKLFRSEMREEMQKRVSMLNLARDALSQDRILPFYQPKVDLRTGRLDGFEALLRWKHPNGAIQAPATVAAAFEDMNLAADISDRMVMSVIEDMRHWRDRGIDFGHVAINAAAAEFRRGDFAERLLERFHAASIPPQCVQIEVTETVFLGRGAEYVEKALRTLSRAGVRIALDDFGTGYASLSHLKQFPVDIIKIDRSFVRDLHSDPEDAAIIDAVINLGRSLGIQVVAEGIETTAQHALLSRMGCDFGQGFLYGKAASAALVPASARKVFGQLSKVA